MHDKAIFLHHDLGQFVTNDQVLSWTLGLGYSLSYNVTAWMLKQDEHAQWLAWLACLQQNVCARYLGEPLRAFKHDRAPLLATDGDPRAHRMTRLTHLWDVPCAVIWDTNA